MLEPKTVHEEANIVNLDFKLDERQRGILNAECSTEGWDILQHLLIDVVRSFNTTLANTPVSEPEAVLRNHIAAKVAAQMFQAFYERVSEELNIYRYSAAKLGTMENPEPAPVAPDFQ
jgi:hypothetical protein